MFLVLLAVGLLPAVLAAGIGLILAFTLKAKAPALQVGVWAFVVVSGLFAIYQAVMIARDVRDNPAYATGSVAVIALPLFATAVGAFAFAFGWGAASLAVEGSRLAAGRTGTGGAALRAVGPVLLAIAAAAYLWLSQEPSDYERYMAVKDDPAAVAALFREGIDKADAGLLQTVGASEHLTPLMVGQLVDHPFAEVRWKAAGRRDLTPKDMLKLAGDPDDRVRDQLLNNPRLTPDALGELAKGDSNVARRARAELDRRATTNPTSAPTS